MFGNDVLVATALEAGKKECMTCLPARIERVYAWSGKLVQGGQEVMAQFCST